MRNYMGKILLKAMKRRVTYQWLWTYGVFSPYRLEHKTFYNSTNSDTRKSYPNMLIPQDSNYLE